MPPKTEVRERTVSSFLDNHGIRFKKLAAYKLPAKGMFQNPVMVHFTEGEKAEGHNFRTPNQKPHDNEIYKEGQDYPVGVNVGLLIGYIKPVQTGQKKSQAQNADEAKHVPSPKLEGNLRAIVHKRGPQGIPIVNESLCRVVAAWNDEKLFYYTLSGPKDTIDGVGCYKGYKESDNRFDDIFVLPNWRYDEIDGSAKVRGNQIKAAIQDEAMRLPEAPPAASPDSPDQILNVVGRAKSFAIDIGMRVRAYIDSGNANQLKSAQVDLNRITGECSGHPAELICNLINIKGVDPEPAQIKSAWKHFWDEYAKTEPEKAKNLDCTLFTDDVQKAFILSNRSNTKYLEIRLIIPIINLVDDKLKKLHKAESDKQRAKADYDELIDECRQLAQVALGCDTHDATRPSGIFEERHDEVIQCLDFGISDLESQKDSVVNRCDIVRDQLGPGVYGRNPREFLLALTNRTADIDNMRLMLTAMHRFNLGSILSVVLQPLVKEIEAKIAFRKELKRVYQAVDPDEEQGGDGDGEVNEEDDDDDVTVKGDAGQEVERAPKEESVDAEEKKIADGDEISVDTEMLGVESKTEQESQDAGLSKDNTPKLEEQQNAENVVEDVRMDEVADVAKADGYEGEN